MNIERRAHQAAEAANRRAATTDTHALYARVARSGERNSPAIWAAGVAVTAAAAIAVVVAINTDRGVVVETPDPLGTPTEAPATPTDGPPVTGDCSAAGLTPELRDQEIPPAVEETRALLAELAVACDLEELAALAAADQTTISYGLPDDAAAYWEQVEDEGDPALRMLRVLLETDPFVQTFESADMTIATWPALAALDPNVPEHADRMEGAIEDVVATGLYTREEVDEILSHGSGWLGWRVGITDDGTWAFFVAGD